MHITLNGRRIILPILLCLFSFLLETITAHAQIYSYTNATTGAPASVNANATAGNLTRVNGAAAPGTPCGSGFSSANFTNAAVYSATLPAVNLDLTPNSGYQLNITGINIGLRRSNTGPANARLAYSTDNGVTWIDQGFNVAPNNAGCGSVTNYTWTFSSTISLTTIFKFRVYLFTASGTGGTQQIMNFNINGTVASSTTLPCTTPASAANFLYSIISPAQTNVNFTAPTPPPSGYIAVRSTSPTLSANPVSGTTYNVNDAIGGGTVIYKGTATSFSSTGLNPALDYYYFIFAYNNTNCTGGPLYATALSGVDSLPAPVVATNPTDSTACTGMGASFSITATNPISYQWQEFTGSWTNITNNAVYSGATTQTLSISDVTGLDGHQYRCMVTGSLGHTAISSTASLHLHANTTISAQPANASACENSDTSFRVHATGYNLTYQWQENQGSGFADISNNTLYSGATTDALVLATTTASMNGYTYRCIIHNDCGKSDTTTIAALTVNTNPVAAITAGSTLSFCQNDSVVLQANNGTGYTYQWLFNGAAISSATGSNHTAYNAGAYSVIVTDTNHCSTASANDTVTIFALPVATITPSGNSNICAGSSTTLNANTGTGLNYQWQENNVDIPGATNAFYSTSANGSYTVIVSNSNNCKKISAAATVTVMPYPVAMAAATSNTTICQGNSVTINTQATAGLTYQWLLDGNQISGATNNYYNATATGNYTVVTANIAGCADTSNAVPVTMIPVLPAAITPVGALIFCAGDSVKLQSNTLTGATYQWQYNGNNIPAATDTAYKAMNTGNYTVVVTNASGCPTTSAPVAVTVNPTPNSIITYSTPVKFCQDGAVVLTASIPTGMNYQWMKDSNPIAGANAYSYICAQTGNYSLVTSNSFGCTTTSGPVAVTVYPKPQPVITRNNYTLSTGSYVSYKWYFNSQPIPGATSQAYTATQNGGYFVEVTDANGCVNRAPLMFINNVGITTVSQQAAIRIYPNPVNDIIHIEAPFSTDLAVRDQLGKLVFEGRGVSAVDMSPFADGIYFLTIFDADHQFVGTQKINKTSR